MSRCSGPLALPSGPGWGRSPTDFQITQSSNAGRSASPINMPPPGTIYGSIHDCIGGSGMRSSRAPVAALQQDGRSRAILSGRFGSFPGHIRCWGRSYRWYLFPCWPSVSIAWCSSPSCQRWPPFVVATVVSALVPALLMNVSIVGLNQIYDIEIDRTNKPYLPIPSGELAVGDAWRIVGATAGASLALGAAASSLPLMCTLVGSLLLGVAYSVDAPMLRWKRYPTLAAMCILSVRAVLVQFGFFFHARQALAGSVGMAGMESMTSMTSVTSMATSNQALYFATAFMFIFSIVIALFKDIPDVRGDKLNKMNTFTVRLGARRVFWTCIGLLQAAYASSIVYSLVYLKGWTCAGSVVAHGAVALLILRRALRTDLDSASNIYGCYMDIWKAFYFEYLLIPLFAAAV